MTRTKLLALLLSVSVVGNLFLAYRVVDMAVTIDHGAAGHEHRTQQLRDMERLFPSLVAADLSLADLENAADAAGIAVQRVDDGLYVGSIRFGISNDEVTSAHFD